MSTTRTAGLISCTLFCAAVAAAAAQGKVKVYKSLVSDDDVTVAVAPYGTTPDKHVLIRISGVTHAVDGQTLLYEVRPRKAGGADYYVAGTKMLLFSSRRHTTLLEGTRREYSEVYAGRDPVRVIYLRDKAPQGLAQELLSDYRRSQGLQETPPDQKTAQGMLDKAAQSFAKACKLKGTPKVSIAWATFDRRKQRQWVVAGQVYVNAMRELCADADYRQALAGVKTLSFRLADDSQHHAIQVAKDTVTVDLAEEQPNIRWVAKRWFEDNL